jgi:hypothetical protein
MRRTAGAVAVPLALASMASGCILVTGGTEGYSAPDGAVAVSLACTGSTDCEGGVCCYSLAGQIPTSQCQAACDRAFEQACGTAQDCGDGGACFMQTCALAGGPTVSVTTCGPIPLCTQ